MRPRGAVRPRAPRAVPWRRSGRPSALVAAALLAVACDRILDPYAARGTGDLAGCLVGEDGAPFDGAVVTTEPPAELAATSTAGGAYRLRGIPAGRVLLRAVGPRRELWEASLTVVTGENPRAACLRPTGRLSTRTTNPGTGRLEGCLVAPGDAPAVGALVWIQGRYAVAHVSTDAGGCFGLADVPAGPVTLLATLEPWGLVAPTAVVADRTMSLGRVALASMGWLSGAVTRAEGGDGVPAIEVSTDDGPLWTWSRANGTFALRVPHPACWDLTGQALNFEDARISGACSTTSSRTPSLEARMVTRAEREPLVFLGLDPLPRGVAMPGTAIDGTTLYVAGGQDGPGALPFTQYQVADLQEYDFATGAWRNDPNVALPVARVGASAAFLDGQLYVIGGYRVGQLARDGSARCDPESLVPYGEDRPGLAKCYLARVDRFDPERRTWAPVAYVDGAWQPEPGGPPQLDAPVAFAAASQSTQAIYLSMGVRLASADNPRGYEAAIRVLALHRPGVVAPAWSKRPAPVRYGRERAIGVVSGRRFYLLGGDAEIPAECSRDVYALFFPAFEWDTSLPPAPARYSTSGFVAGRFLYVVGTGAAGPPDRWTAVLDLDARTWSREAQLPPIQAGFGFQVQATPHGFVQTAGGDWSRTSSAAYAGVGVRFVDRALSRYARGVVTTPWVEPDAITPPDTSACP